jgi:hypothetical protein
MFENTLFEKKKKFVFSTGLTIKHTLIVTKGTKTFLIFYRSQFFKVLKNQIKFERIMFRFGARKVKIKVHYLDSNYSRTECKS